MPATSAAQNRLLFYFFAAAVYSTTEANKASLKQSIILRCLWDKHSILVLVIEIVVNSRRRMHLCMQDDQNGQKMMVLTSAEETRLTCFILLQNIFFLK